MPSYDTQNIFAKILRGEFPCYKVYEDDHVLAFLDIMPRSPGHTLVIPKAPARNILDISAEDFAHVARASHKIAHAAMKAFAANGILSFGTVIIVFVIGAICMFTVPSISTWIISTSGISSAASNFGRGATTMASATRIVGSFI